MWIRLLFCLLVNAAAFGVLPPKISLKIYPENALAYQPIPLYITVIHKETEVIDLNSVCTSDISLPVEIIQRSRVGVPNDDAPDVVTRLKTILPARPQGFCTIGPVHMTINQDSYTSGSITVHVQGVSISDKFRITSNIKGPSTLFPGQTVMLEYVIYFSSPMKITNEVFPLFSCAGFDMIGSVRVTDDIVDGEYIQTIQQTARAMRPGSYDVDGALVDAMMLENNEPQLPIFRAQTRNSKISISPFPTPPEGFTGAIGSFVWRSSVCDIAKGQVEYRVSGRGELSSVSFPTIDGVRVIREVESDGMKTFIVESQNHSGRVVLPGFVYYSFDPISRRYVTSNVTPIEIAGMVVGGADDMRALNIEGRSLHEPDFPFWVVICVLLLIIGVGYFEYRFVRRPTRVETSKDIMYKAVRMRGQAGLKLLKQALYMRVHEEGLTPKLCSSCDSFNEGILYDVRAVIQAIDQQLYGNCSRPVYEVYDDASALYSRLSISRRGL